MRKCWKNIVNCIKKHIFWLLLMLILITPLIAITLLYKIDCTNMFKEEKFWFSYMTFFGTVLLGAIAIWQTEKDKRPRLELSFEIYDSRRLCFVLKNTGTKRAENIKISFDSAFVSAINDTYHREHIEKLNSSVFNMSVNQDLYIFFGSIAGGNITNFKKVYIEFSYENNWGVSYVDKIEFDLEGYHWMILPGETQLDGTVKSIDKSFKKIQQENKAFHNNILDYLASPKDYQSRKKEEKVAIEKAEQKAKEFERKMNQ